MPDMSHCLAGARARAEDDHVLALLGASETYYAGDTGSNTATGRYGLFLALFLAEELVQTGIDHSDLSLFPQ